MSPTTDEAATSHLHTYHFFAISNLATNIISTQKKVKMIKRPPHGVEEEVIAYDEDVVISRK
jgi:hypothetical protein